MYDESYGLRFDIYERVHLSDDLVGIDQLEEVELTPHIQVIPSGEQVTVRGSLLLAGVYVGSSQERKSESLEHWIPVEITLPLNRVRSLEDICVDIEHFDVDLLSSRSLNVTGVLSLKGITVEQPSAPAWEPEQITVMHESAREGEEPAWIRDYDQAGDRPYLTNEVVPQASLRATEGPPQAQISSAAEDTQASRPVEQQTGDIGQVSEQYASTFYQQQLNQQPAPSEVTAFADRIGESSSGQEANPEAIQAQDASAMVDADRDEALRQESETASPTVSQSVEGTPEPLQASTAQEEEERIFAVNKEALTMETETEQPLWGDLLAKKAQQPMKPEAKPEAASQEQAQAVVSGESSSTSSAASVSQPSTNLTWSDTPWSKASVAPNANEAVEPIEDLRGESEKATEPVDIPESTIEEVQREAEAILSAEEQEREQSEVMEAEAHEPELEAAPVVQEKKEMKVAIGSSKPTSSAPGTEPIGYSSILASSKQNKEKEREAEQRINEEEQQMDAPAAEDVNWQSLFLNRVQDDRGFRKVRMCIVQRDETLDTIAGRYEMNPREIAMYNCLEEDALTQGQVLYIPS